MRHPTNTGQLCVPLHREVPRHVASGQRSLGWSASPHHGQGRRERAIRPCAYTPLAIGHVGINPSLPIGGWRRGRNSGTCTEIRWRVTSVTLGDVYVSSQGRSSTAWVSSREFDVLEAVAERMTNAEIVDRLSVSHRTVESHVSSLLRKLGPVIGSCSQTGCRRKGTGERG